MTGVVDNSLLTCYNKGCGQQFNPNDNKNDSCAHHPGAPIFHDAYKSWSCCKKRCIDFTEFLNIKGCTKSFHSNEKPPEPEKPIVDKTKVDEVIEYRAPTSNFVGLKRPSFDTEQTIITPTVSTTLLEQIKTLTANKPDTCDSTIIKIGESCKNKSCNGTYKNSESDNEICIYHPGVPIFHEGLKYWSCCPKKKTTDFSVFLALPGCTNGKHVWIVKNNEKKIECRMDWHQTGSHVVVAIYAKKYQPSKSSIKLNPIRLTIGLFFLEENSSYDLDLELRGVVDIANSSVSMLPTKVEIKMKKAEPGTWSSLDIPKLKSEQENDQSNDKINNEMNDDVNDRVDAVDLSDL
ncbi:hypothetical protein HCN44_005137 [Aphidius gifuensis]|uniref:Cysteine and histidine-rich domain-containing protein n=1 Tax=Aphidius gifuensis TaxID=684658 RepID=A0A835CT12_APHGI|nr:cysteine and histidine-rich domain-containing protein [Aphidius gifuensis]KAF7992793.1 hypothetical protein HCN44_005137 [Aphidius gifuensis]